MSRNWEQGPVDMMMIENLERYNFLRGRTLVKLCSPLNEKKGYDRIRYLIKGGYVEGDQYANFKKDFPKCFMYTKDMRGKIFYLTAKGKTALKEVKGEPITGKEKTRRPNPEVMPVYYSISAIIENIDLDFGSPRKLREAEDLNNFATVDLVYEDWQIIVQRQSTRIYLYHLLKQCESNSVKGGCRMLILSPSEAKRAALIRFWKEQYGAEAKFLRINDYESIAKIIQDETPAEIENAFKIQGIPIEKLPQPEDNYTHLINGRLCTLVDLIGFPAREFRHLYKSNKRPFAVLSSFSDLQVLTKRFPECAKSLEGFMTLDSLSGTKDEIRRMLNARKA